MARFPYAKTPRWSDIGCGVRMFRREIIIFTHDRDLKDYNIEEIVN